jgi:hypothetical protein
MAILRQLPGTAGYAREERLPLTQANCKAYAAQAASFALRFVALPCLLSANDNEALKYLLYFPHTLSYLSSVLRFEE